MKTKQVKGIQFRLEVEKQRKMMPDPASLLQRAQRFPEAPKSLSASDYATTVDQLRRKGYTWRECSEWLKAHGADFSEQAVISGHRNWLRWMQEQNFGGVKTLRAA